MKVFNVQLVLFIYLSTQIIQTTDTSSCYFFGFNHIAMHFCRLTDEDNEEPEHERVKIENKNKPKQVPKVLKRNNR